MSFLPIIVLLFLVMWLVVIRPQRKRQAQQQRMFDQMAPGDEVLTAGGVFGTLKAVDEDEVLVEIAPGVEIRVARRAIASVVAEDAETELEELERLQHEAQDEAQAVAAGDPTER